MGHIKEPKGVDFIIKSEPLTDKEQAAISEFIKNYKIKHSKKKTTIAKKSVAPNIRKRVFA
ncbi:MAG TPA: hypothetical protein VNE41_05585 [Chitinophagaceae bacterium]|nr:hypothetical protein [Chitinophagaceae bacterium]HVB03171.1 hypothetical protein [Chitinophagaceae bacterium]